MLDHAASIVAVLTFIGAVAGALFKLVRWGIRQDLAIAALQKDVAAMKDKIEQGEWAGQVFVLPRGEQRQRERVTGRSRRRLVTAVGEDEE